jgi:hypothetical protein
MPVHEGHDVKFRVDLRRRKDADFQLPGLHPLNELPHAGFHVLAVLGMFKLGKNLARHALFGFGVGAKVHVHLLLCLRQKLEGWPICAESDKDSNYLRRPKRLGQSLKSAEVEIANQAIESSRVFSK